MRTRTPTPSASASPSPTPAAAENNFLYRELGADADTIWSVPSNTSGQRRQLAQIPHATNYGAWPALSPDKRYIAFAKFPSGGIDPRFDAELWLLDTTSGENRLLAQQVLLQSLPQWAPDGSAVTTLRLRPDTAELIEVQLSGGAPKGERVILSVRTADVFGIAPLGYANDGRHIYISQIPAASPGTDIAAVDTANGQVEVLFRAGPSTIVDPTLSPDRTRLAWVGVGCSSVCVGDLTSGQVQTLTSTDLGAPPYFRPAWAPDGYRIAVGRQPGPGGAAGAVAVGLDGSSMALMPPGKGFDAPMAWSPDGRLLIVHSSDSPSIAQPGVTKLVLIDLAGGTRRELAATNSLVDVLSIGWLGGG